MKNKKFATAMLAAVLACTVAVSGCGKPDNGGDDGGNTGGGGLDENPLG